MRCLFFCMLCAALFVTSFRAVADGPHWQVPNPEYDPGKEDEKKKKDKKDKKNKKNKKNKKDKKKPQRGDPPKLSSTSGMWGNYDSNPGDFLKMDDTCIKYYERHCAILYDGTYGYGLEIGVPSPAKKPKTKEEMRRWFYLLIMQRCAQAMREVDQYLPCPDSLPMWHEEVTREKMVQYATRTWVLASKLPAEDAKACLEFCVKAYTDTVRFSNDLRNPRMPRWLAELAKKNKDVATLLDQMAAEKDEKKKGELKKEWWKAAGNAAGFGKGFADRKLLAKAYTTFRLITGDIPLCVSDAEVRMAQALVEIGPSVIPFLLRDPARNNPNVQRAVKALIQTIKSRYNLNNDLISMNPTAQNVTDLLRQIAAKPLDMGAQARRRALESMGPKAWDHLVRLAKSEAPEVQKEALRMLRTFTRKPEPATLEEIKAGVAELLAAEKAKEAPPPKPLDLNPTLTKKDDGKEPVAPPEEEEE